MWLFRNSPGWPIPRGVKTESSLLSESNIDLWQQFTDDLPVEQASVEKPPLDKSDATDGSEWTGKFDRRARPRDQSGDESDQADVPGNNLQSNDLQSNDLQSNDLQSKDNAEDQVQLTTESDQKDDRIKE